MLIEKSVRKGSVSAGTRASRVGKRARYFVPDISPIDREELQSLKPRYVFVAESPHLSEVESDSIDARRPLCGAAGRAWWSQLGEVLQDEESEDVSLKRMMDLARRYRVAVINAVQFPLDPKITARYPDAEPVANLGFAKAAGEFGYKRQKKSAGVQKAVENLRARLMDPALAQAEIWALGNDAEWFVAQALTPEELTKRVKGKIPHPSAWWRRGGLFGRIAEEKLNGIFKRGGTA